MADDNFRSYRSRDPLTRDQAAGIATDEGDPLAELARLIGQSEPYADGRRADAHHPAPSRNEVETDRDWAADAGYAEQHGHAEDHYVPPPLPSAADPSYAPERRRYTEEPSASDRYFSGPATQFNGFNEETDEETEADYRGAQMPLRAPGLPAYADAGTDEDYATDEQGHAAGEGNAADEYYDEPARPRRRNGLVLVMAVCSLIVVGTAGAFGYRAMFNGSVLPTLPPIIKASNGPNKIAPSYGDAQANTPGQSGGASAGSAEHLVSREEQPVSMEPPKAAPRVVATIPIVSGENSAQPGTSAPAASPWPNAPTQTQTPAWPNPPAAAAASPNSASPTAKAAQTAPQSPTPSSAPASAEPKRIHTVVIRTDQPGASEAAPSPQEQQAAPASPPRPAARPAQAAKSTTVAASAAAAGSNAPLSIVPGGKGEAAAPAVTHAQAPARPVAVASAGSVGGMVATPSSGGGYAVQVTSQRSEAEAHAAFRELRAKYPSQLSGREPIIRRADLGAKGTYYRALVGPFASMAEAAGMCSNLKAAGGNCLVQRN
jgi:SPOR domain